MITDIDELLGLLKRIASRRTLKECDQRISALWGTVIIWGAILVG